jgi:hypothetical protein
MPVYIRVPLGIELLLLVAEVVWPASHPVLPLGGSHFVQVAVLVLCGIAIHELRTALNEGS